MTLRDELKPHDTVASTSCLAAKLRKAAESLKRTQANCDHDFEDIGNGQQQCTYPECQKINATSRAAHGLPSHIPRARDKDKSPH